MIKFKQDFWLPWSWGGGGWGEGRGWRGWLKPCQLDLRLDNHAVRAVHHTFVGLAILSIEVNRFVAFHNNQLAA